MDNGLLLYKMEQKCSTCGEKNPTSKCGRCDVLYCSRNCQLKQWNTHKLICKSEQKATAVQKSIDILFSRVCHIIAGNIIILNAWYRQKRGFVEIEITETLSDFASPGTHFLHMVYNDIPDDPYDKYSELDKCYVRFKLNNYEYESYIPIRLSAPDVRAKQPQPSREWTLMYDL